MSFQQSSIYFLFLAKNQESELENRPGMLFNSEMFLGFFVVVYLAYLALRNRLKAQNFLLLFSSYVFYGAWDYRFLVLIWFSTAVDYLVGIAIHQSVSRKRRKRLLALSIVTNLGTLAFFKYFNFFAENLSRLLNLSPDSITLSIVLPVGISFYTFQSMSYTIDVYRGELEPCRSPIDFALYVAFFPQLVAGPIERAGRLLGQIGQRRNIEALDIELGLYFIVWGYYKKVVVADNLAAIADPVFDSSFQAQGLDVWIGLLAFCFQIYCDFSGYSSIARGVARLMGFRLVRNFRIPYSALTPSEFWKRWHISLSQWLRDYLYIPLGGNRGGSARVYRNLAITMILGGLWHGAAWNFCLWGAYHGFLLSVYRAGAIQPGRSSATRVAQWATMSLLTLYGWLLFRAGSVQEIGYLTLELCSFQSSDSTAKTTYDLIFFTAPLIFFECLFYRKRDLLFIPRKGTLALVMFQVFCLTSIFALRAPGTSQFLYFQF